MSIFLTKDGQIRRPSQLREGSSLKDNNVKVLQELEINGKNVDDDDDFTMKDEDENNKAANGEQSPEDAADNASDPTPGEEDSDDDFTLDDEDFEDDTTDNDNANPEDQPTEEETPAEDNAGDQTQEAPTTTDDNAEGTDDDFTLKDSDVGGGEDAGGEAGGEGGGDTGDATADAGSAAIDTDTNDDPKDSVNDEEVKAAEEEIYDSLSEDQKRIRTLQLKIDYKDFYDTINSTMIGVNAIPKTEENLPVIKKLSDFMIKTKSILIDYIENNFDKNTYMENYANYIKFIAVFRTVAKVISMLSANEK